MPGGFLRIVMGCGCEFVCVFKGSSLGLGLRRPHSLGFSLALAWLLLWLSSFEAWLRASWPLSPCSTNSAGDEPVVWLLMEMSISTLNNDIRVLM